MFEQNVYGMLLSNSPQRSRFILHFTSPTCIIASLKFAHFERCDPVSCKGTTPHPNVAYSRAIFKKRFHYHDDPGWNLGVLTKRAPSAGSPCITDTISHEYAGMHFKKMIYVQP